jgi:hypothetical protein
MDDSIRVSENASADRAYVVLIDKHAPSFGNKGEKQALEHRINLHNHSGQPHFPLDAS